MQRLTRLLTYVLRHEPGACGLMLSAEGWIDLDLLASSIRNSNPCWAEVTESSIRSLAETQDRFQIAGNKIRCTYGHSVGGITVGDEALPPNTLFHATKAALFPAIRREGLKPFQRNHVHLTSDWDYAISIRTLHDSNTARGVILAVNSGGATDHGIKFLRATRSVWLSGPIPASFLKLCLVRNDELVSFAVLDFSGRSVLKDVLSKLSDE